MSRFLTYAVAACLALAAAACSGDDARSEADGNDKPKPAYRTESLRGRGVWLAEAMKRRYGVESDPDAAQTSVALETDDGQLLPIVKDFRGRGFYSDPKLREIDLELLVRRYPGAPAVQVVRVYSLHDGGKYELDYWCDVCSIPMYELKECECCQGPIRIRERLVEKRDRPKPASSKDEK